MKKRKKSKSKQPKSLLIGKARKTKVDETVTNERERERGEKCYNKLSFLPPFHSREKERDDHSIKPTRAKDMK